jgi:hypothetical protein
MSLFCLRTPGTWANHYQSIGVEPVINCVGTTPLSWLLERRGCSSHAQHPVFRSMMNLLSRGCRQLAELTGAEWECYLPGAAGMEHVTAACVTGGIRKSHSYTRSVGI